MEKNISKAANYLKNFSLVFYKKVDGKSLVVKRIRTKSQSKFTRRLRLIPNEFDALLSVSYSDGGNNSGIYQSKEDLMLAYSAFIER